MMHFLTVCAVCDQAGLMHCHDHDQAGLMHFSTVYAVCDQAGLLQCLTD